MNEITEWLVGASIECKLFDLWISAIEIFLWHVGGLKSILLKNFSSSSAKFFVRYRT